MSLSARCRDSRRKGLLSLLHPSSKRHKMVAASAKVRSHRKQEAGFIYGFLRVEFSRAGHFGFIWFGFGGIGLVWFWQ